MVNKIKKCKNCILEKSNIALPVEIENENQKSASVKKQTYSTFVEQQQFQIKI